VVKRQEDKMIKIETIRELLMGQDSYIGEFAEASISSFEEFSKDFSKHMISNDMEKLRRAGHKIRPVAQMLNIDQVIDEYERGKRFLENQPNPQEIEQSIQKMNDLCNRIIGEFKQIIHSLPG